MQILAASELALQLKQIFEALEARTVYTVEISRGACSFTFGPHQPLLPHAHVSLDRPPQLHSHQALLLREPAGVIAHKLGPTAAPGLVRFVDAIGRADVPPPYATSRKRRTQLYARNMC